MAHFPPVLDPVNVRVRVSDEVAARIVDLIDNPPPPTPYLVALMSESVGVGQRYNFPDGETWVIHEFRGAVWELRRDVAADAPQADRFLFLTAEEIARLERVAS